VIALVLAALVAAAPGPAVQRFALVVGHNQPPRPELPRLRYGDDDAVRWATLLRGYGAEVELLTTLDDESRRLYGDRLPALAEPTRAQVEAAMERLGGAIRAARAAGRRTVFYFVYAGHGDVDNGEGYVALAGGRLTRRDLEEVILAGSGADTNHVVVDACRSYYFVYDRGPGGAREAWHDPYFVSGAAARFRNTGFLLASSTEAPTHEWEEFQAGIFSHELRSGLLGSADLDGDGRISYDELAAFVRVANRPIRNQRFRPELVARAPATGDGVFLDLSDATGGTVDIGTQPAARYLLEDDLGVRWADLHPGRPVTLRLPVAPWRPTSFFFRRWGGEDEYRIPADARTSLANRTRVPASTLARGAAHEAFAQLFAEPFDENALRAESTVAVKLEERREETTHRPLRTMAWMAGAVGATALVAAGALTVVGLVQRADTTSGMDRQRYNQRIESLRWWRNASVIGGAALVAGAAALFVVDRGEPAVVVAPVPGGAVVSVAAPLR
jgi:hypothetical protein